MVEDGSVILMGLIVHERPEGGDTVKVTVPEKPFCPVRLIVEMAETPVLTADGDEAVREKSGVELGLEVIMNAREVGLTIVPLVVVTVTV